MGRYLALLDVYTISILIWNVFWEVNMTEDILEMPVIKQTESIKLAKMSKGYNWEIKLLEIDISRLEKLNNEMVDKFGE